MAGNSGGKEPAATEEQVKDLQKTVSTLLQERGPAYTSEEKAIRKTVSDTKQDVSRGINEVRETAFTLSGHQTSPFGVGRKQGGQSGNALLNDPCETSIDDSIPLEWEKIPRWAREINDCARKLQDLTEQITVSSAPVVLTVTSRAGKLLGATERLLAAHEYQVEVADNARRAPAKGGGTTASQSAVVPMGPGGGAVNPPPTSAERSEVLSRALTVVFTARDHLTAARGHARDVIAKVGRGEIAWLLVGLFALGVSYLVLHPLLPGGPHYISATLRPQYEIIFWSIFGAIAISVITIATETVRGTFDPARRFKYTYKILLAPVVAYGLLLFFGGVGQALLGTGEEGVGLDPVNPNIPVVVLLSFLFGFFGKRSLDLLENAWDAFMSRLPTGGKATSESTTDTTKVEKSPPGETVTTESTTVTSTTPR